MTRLTTVAETASLVAIVEPDAGAATGFTNYAAPVGLVIGYSSSAYPALTNLREVADYLLYVSPTVSLSGGSTVEAGSTVANVALSWVCNKVMISRDLSAPVPVGDRARGPGQNGSYTHVGANLTSNTTYTIVVDDGSNTANGSTSVLFRWKRYWGTSPNTSLNDAEIIALANSELATSRAKSFTISGGGEYIYYVYPAAWGTATFTVNGLLNTAWTLSVQSHTNASGGTTNYNVYRSNTVQHGSGISIVVS